MNFPERFQLTSRFLESQDYVLVGNRGRNAKHTLGGAAFMFVPRTKIPGSIWKAIPIGNGFFKLTTELVHAQGLYLEGNGGYGTQHALDGAAFMHPDANVTGMQWKTIDLNNGYFQLTTRFVEPKGLVLEGNGGRGEKHTLGGAAFMSPQKNATGTMWRILKV